MDEEFIEENSQAVFEEMAKSINIMNAIMSSIIETPDDDTGEIAQKKMMFQMFHTLGALTALFNQYYVLKTGVIPKEEEKLIGFASMVDKD